MLGGSFSALSINYRINFIKEINEFLAQDFKCLNGIYKARCSVLTVESRPDQITENECDLLHQLGVSKVEIGVQHTEDKILKKNLRDHSQENIKFATKLLKQWGFKVGYHVMLGLPHSTENEDFLMLHYTLWNSDYNPDYIKIYPCELLSQPEQQPVLYKLVTKNLWQPKDESYFLRILNKSAPFIPNTVRISRIQRQFSFHDRTNHIKAGMRNRVTERFNDISSREAKSALAKNRLLPLAKESIYLKSTSIGELEIFIECLFQDILIGIGRIYFNKTYAMLREIKIYGYVASVGKSTELQGNGVGSILLQHIEKIAQEKKCHSLIVNAAPGARSFFLKHNYIIGADLYLRKNLTK